MRNFESKPTKRGEEIHFEIHGEHFVFQPPKQAALMLAMVEGASDKGPMASFMPIGSMFAWLSYGLSKEHEGTRKKSGHEEYVEGCQSCRLHDRLLDPEDDLDIDQVTEIINWLLGEVSGRPTT